MSGLFISFLIYLSISQVTIFYLFRAKIDKPLVVQFKDEMGIDQGGLRADLISLLLDFFEKMIGPDHEIYCGQEIVEDDETLSKPEAEKKLFAYGVFSSIAVVQCGYCQPFVLEWYDKLSSTSQHPFIRGLMVLNVTWARKKN